MKQHLQVKYTKLYEDLRAAKDTGHRKLIQKEIDALRQKYLDYNPQKLPLCDLCKKEKSIIVNKKYYNVLHVL